MPEGAFTRAELLEAARLCAPIEETGLRNLIASLMSEGRISRVGRGLYEASAPRPAWRPDYSEEGLAAARLVEERFPLLDFRVWETSWLNEFLNHLVARNTVLVCVENDGCGFAFEALAEASPGRVLLKPSPEDAMRYGRDGSAAIVRLVSEAPAGRPERYRAAAEQVVVDMVADKLVRSLLPQGDYPDAVAGIANRYALDQSALLRYARRRGKEGEVRSLLAEAGVDVRV